MTPDEHTNQELMLDVGGGHKIYVHDWGKVDAPTSILFVHGGPGNGSQDRDKQKFDPATQRVIFYDQRGCGKSIPYGSLEHNTTPELVADIQNILNELQLEKVILIGGSWAPCLALAFGLAHPERVSGMILYGIFTGAHNETDWLTNGGYKEFFPEVWERYVASTPAEHSDNPTAYHLERAFGDDSEAAKRSIYTYNEMELALLKLDEQYVMEPYETYDPVPLRIEMHYVANNFFLEPDYIINNASRLTMPITIVHGRYDMVCPPRNAYRLHKTLPNSKLIWTINGHLNQHEAKNIVKLVLERATGAA